MLLSTQRAGFAFLVLVACAAATLFPTRAMSQVPGAESKPAAAGQFPQYILGPNDELTIASVLVEELNDKKVRIATSGDINLAMAGRIRAAGMTIEQLEQVVNERLKTYFKEPDVAINVTVFRSQPVSVIGAVNQPGNKQLEGSKSLIEML